MLVVNGSFLLDILKEQITGYFNKDFIVLDHELIAKRYFRKLFIYDFLGIFPFYISGLGASEEIILAFDFFIFFKVFFLYYYNFRS
jgi:hypothetical protein